MMFFGNLQDAIPLCKALSSEVRVRIIELLSDENGMNLNDLAKALSITNGAMTAHIRVLEECGLIDVVTRVAKHGTQKICFVKPEKFLIDIVKRKGTQNAYHSEIAPGQYIDYQASSPCGLATESKIVGVYDTPQYFSDPEHYLARVVWLTTGHLEYEIPNFLPDNTRPSELMLHAELGSEAPSYCNDWKSDIHVSMNGIELGVWQSPGDFGGVKGVYSPSWWIHSINQYGTLFAMTINHSGCYFDQKRVSDITIDDLSINSQSRIRFRLAVPQGVPESRGLTVFGRGFGNYDNGIVVRVSYEGCEEKICR